MASLFMIGPWDLSHDEINRIFVEKAPGNYALGHTDNAGAFVVDYVGRADEDLNRVLHEHVGTACKFMAKYAVTPLAAFHEHCRNFHDFKPIRNTKHPAHPTGPVCTCDYCDALVGLERRDAKRPAWKQAFVQVAMERNQLALLCGGAIVAAARRLRRPA